MQRTARVAGASGIGGRDVAQELVTNDWVVYGLVRHPQIDIGGLRPVQAW